jgi:hypothetical protein
MKRVLSIVMAIMLAFSTSGVAFAAFTVDGSASFTASTTVGGVPGISVAFSATMRNLSNDNAAGSMTWTGVTAGSTGWLKADQYIAVQGFATYSDWGIQVYTDNDNYTGTGEPAGLIRTDNTLYSLPMCWRTKVGYYDSATGNPNAPGSTAATAQELVINEGQSGGYTVLYDGVSGHEPGGANEYYPWFFMLDKNTTDVDPTTAGNQAYGDYQTEATFIGSAGYHHAPGNVAANFATPSHPQDTYYVYLGAKFTLAVPGATYATDSLTVEMYHL